MNRFGSVERVFAVLMVFTACSMAFAHGSSDVANAVGALGIVVGLAIYGWRVITTVGRKITELTPSRGRAGHPVLLYLQGVFGA